MPRLSQAMGSATGRSRRGFTLPELIVTMALLGIIGAAVVRTLTKQQQVYKDSSRTATMRRELRTSGMIMLQDFRSVSSAGGDALELDGRYFTFNGTYGSSVICQRSAGNANVFFIPPKNLVRHELTNWTMDPRIGDTIYVYNDSIGAGSEDDVWQKLVINDVAQNTSACAGAPFADPALDAPGAKPRYRINASEPGGGNIGDSVKVGAVVRFTRPMKYELYQSSSTGNWFLGYSEAQSGAWTMPEAIAGPFRRFIAGDSVASGLQLRYYDSTGTRVTGNSPAERLRVSRVDVTLRAAGGNSSVTERRGALMTDSTLFRIGLRNYK